MNRIMLAGMAALGLCAVAAGTPAVAQNAPFANRGADKDAAVDKLEAVAVKLEADSKKKPKDAKLKDKTAEAYYQAGYACEYSKVLAPKPKYRGALRLYRKALAFNPKHPKALAEKKQIEDIYKGMGMPIPQ